MAHVAVVVPVYDQEAWLPAAMSSLRAQTLQDSECVVVDDGSLPGLEPVTTGQVSRTWTAHPAQRHRVLCEPWDGLNPYRARYRAQEPLRLQSSVGHLHDEVEHYRRFRERPRVPRASNGLRILLVGELAHNPERILALAERGHELHGLWTDTPVWFNTVSPLPFGHVREVDRGPCSPSTHVNGLISFFRGVLAAGS